MRCCRRARGRGSPSTRAPRSRRPSGTGPRSGGLSRERAAVEHPVRIASRAARRAACGEAAGRTGGGRSRSATASSPGSSSPSRRADSAGGVATTIASASRSSSDVDAHARLDRRTRRARAPGGRHRRASGRAVSRGRTSSPARASASSAVCTVKIPIAALASAAGRFSAGRMKTSQKRSIARSDWPLRSRKSANVSSSCAPGSTPRSANSCQTSGRSRSGRCA